MNDNKTDYAGWLMIPQKLKPCEVLESDSHLYYFWLNCEPFLVLPWDWNRKKYNTWSLFSLKEKHIFHVTHQTMENSLKTGFIIGHKP